MRNTTGLLMNGSTLHQIQSEGFSGHARVLPGVNRGAVLNISGTLDNATTQSLEHLGNSVIADGFVRLVIDAHRVSYVASVGIAALVSLLRRARSRGGSLVLVGVDSRVMDVLQLLGMGGFFGTADTLEEAVTLSEIDQRTPRFPLASTCPVCSTEVTLRSAGQFKCPKCRVVLTVNANAVIHI